MGKATLSVLSGYGLAFAVVILAILCQSLLDLEARVFLFVAAIILSAWYGGLGPGLFSAFLYALVSEFLFPSPALVFSLAETGLNHAVRLSLFLSEGLLLSWLTAAAHDARERNQKCMQEVLQAAQRYRNEFLAMLSHELRNPLAPIRNAVHILRMAQLDDPALVEARDIVDRQVQKMAGIIDDLIDLFGVLNREIVLRSEPVDLALLLRQTVEDARSPLEDHPLTVTLSLPQAPVWITGDRLRLSQVLGSLLRNVAKFTNAGDRVFVRLWTNTDQQRATVSIRDTGAGIPADILPEVFQPFTQAEQSLDRRRGGLGLGLALVKGLIELHGGEVQATSPGPGRGSEVILWLPLGEQPGRSPRRALGEARSVKQLRILIVEDNPDTAKTLGLLLKRYGHEVATALSGTSGVQAAKELRPDIVLCDLGLPEMDGYEVASVLRQDPALAAARLIAVSGYGCDEDCRRSEAAGFDLHLTKPVDPAELQRLLEDLPNHRQLRTMHTQTRPNLP